MSPFDIVDGLIASAVVVKLVLKADQMNGRSQHLFRVALIVLAVSMLAWAMWPVLGEWTPWMDTALVSAIALYIFADRR